MVIRFCCWNKPAFLTLTAKTQVVAHMDTGQVSTNVHKCKRIPRDTWGVKVTVSGVRYKRNGRKASKGWLHGDRWFISQEKRGKKPPVNPCVWVYVYVCLVTGSCVRKMQKVVFSLHITALIISMHKSLFVVRPVKHSYTGCVRPLWLLLLQVYKQTQRESTSERNLCRSSSSTTNGSHPPVTSWSKSRVARDKPPLTTAHLVQGGCSGSEERERERMMKKRWWKMTRHRGCLCCPVKCD